VLSRRLIDLLLSYSFSLTLRPGGLTANRRAFL
jgi:hypothetical protein